ncbi:BIR-domain-containing protein [Microthyrium microscopicum]|uniref:BIR-domain-containing protein n=1 Tax=Microthyrium microscopicum TaxID=703497 RepID=A0A6A6UTQ2_9PEZI|nr:BIR-domain-containing protein [Microthyrium microscopicum]
MPPENAHMSSGRLATFMVGQGPKRRASSAKKRGGAALLRWPHAKPSPEELAKSGFYYVPSASSPDNCQCFACGVMLDGWEPEDIPALEHHAHRTECAWALQCYIKHKFDIDEPIDEDPMSEEYVKGREATFEGWPHEGKRGWKCKVAKMVEAGWFFDPSPSMEDGVTCAYCQTEIGGWERKDDPM